MKSRNLFGAPYLALLAGLLAVAGRPAYSQPAAAKPEPDVLIFTDGEKLIGQLQSAQGGSVTFKSQMAGEITVAWSKIQELHTAQAFAVIPKNVKLGKHGEAAQVLQGKLSVADQKIEVQTAGATRTLPASDAGFVVAQGEYEKAVGHKQGFLEDWGGSVTAGISLVQATQKARSFTGGVALVRAEPTQSWLNPSNRTLVDFSAAYGKVSQPGVSDVKTSIYHADAERDQYFSPRLFGFAQLAYDHNFSQGLDLQQMYGGGLGWTVFKTGTQELDLKASVSYIRQGFQVSSLDHNLIGSTIAQIYTRKLRHGILFNEQISATPAWNETSAYSATGTAGLSIPVFKRFSLAMTALDTFLNDAPPGFKKNSFQFTTGLQYALR
jgi:Protein of unknown function, DUF481